MSARSFHSPLRASLFAATAAALLVACSNGTTETSATTSGSGGSTSSSSGSVGGATNSGGTSTGGGGAANTGGAAPQLEDVGMLLNVSIIEMMGQKVGLAVAAFYPETNIAPFDPTKELAGFTPDTCRVPAAATAECQKSSDCPIAGQICKAEKDSSGQPTPGTGTCENPTGSPIDVGAMELDGFLDGAKQLKYNPGQNGAYTPDGAGDGQVPQASIATDVDYTFSGAGDAAKGLGAFSGTLHLPPAIELLAPVPAVTQLGKEITVDTTADLPLQWAGSSNGYVKITIGTVGGSIECLANDDGAFTITKEWLSKITLGDFAFFNIVTLERTSYGTASGTGLVNPQISSKMTTMVNAAKPVPTP